MNGVFVLACALLSQSGPTVEELIHQLGSPRIGEREQATEALGKTAGKDEAQGKLTYVALLGLEGARTRAAALERDALAQLANLGEAAEPLRDLARFVVSRGA